MLHNWEVRAIIQSAQSHVYSKVKRSRVAPPELLSNQWKHRLQYRIMLPYSHDIVTKVTRTQQ